MLYDYQREELRVQAARAEHKLKSNCPLLEDEMIFAVWNHIQELEEWIEAIADDHPQIPDWIQQSARSLLAQESE